MIKRNLRRRIIALCSASAAILATTVAASPPASADSRTMVLSFSCATGLPYGLYINTGSGWYSPPGSSYADGTTKVFTISIPTNSMNFQYQPSYCDNQPTDGGYPMWEGYTYGIGAGTSTVNAVGGCADYTYSVGYGLNYLLYYCSISSLTYS
ncbi:hypothetical protein Caci_3743 [Catenulispora acidiphila DSM 44928]|uniref:Uncharacterized protein n=1 Tax=Catenulispora acidiphila (strain DSM 44928 / JCM 14897 / NBRC 102108 / NRRL B-24433 / ID139908) TaxID=479433 RepID=C7QC26_CATAD|nr:hypothetical protein [Catenulispora acidiphila]ACU72645.1 hypothetical protein Caci_3743 [Catenulispora acidiphila DSM 44928]